MSVRVVCRCSHVHEDHLCPPESTADDMTVEDSSPSRDGLYLQVYPSTLVNASRMGKIGRSLQATGLFRETHLVGVQADGQESVEDLAAGLRIVRLPGSGSRSNLGRVLRGLLWQPRVLSHYRRQRVAIVAAHNVWVLPMCWVLSRRVGAKLIYNAHELETEAIAMTGVKQRVAKIFENALVRHCALVSVVNEPIADWYESTYHIPRPVVVGNVPVVVDADTRLRERLNIPIDEMMYIHTGHLVDGRNIPLILSVFSQSSNHVVFLGDGPHRESIVEAGQRHRSIHWLAPVPPDLIVAHVREADVGLCLIDEQQSLSDRLSSPNKLLEALAADIPALCSNLVEARRLLGDHADQWILMDPEKKLAAAVQEIGKADCKRFRSTWRGVRTWDQEVAPLTAGIAALMGSARSARSPVEADPASMDRQHARAVLESDAEKE